MRPTTSAPRVKRVRIDVLGPLVVTIIDDRDHAVVIDADWRRANAAVLREIAAKPGGASGHDIARRADHKKPYDAVTDARTVLAPYGVTVSSFPGERGYSLVAGDSAVEIDSDLHEFRERARVALEIERTVRPTENGARVETQQLFVLNQAVSAALELWRVAGASEREAVLQTDPALAAASSDLQIEIDLQLARLRALTGLAEAYGTEAHIADAKAALSGLSSRAPTASADRYRNLVRRLENDLKANDVEVLHESDVFLSAPMASTSNDYDPVRALALRVAEALSGHCGFESVYWAGETITSVDAFENPSTSLQRNIGPFKSARAFAMLLPKQLASSVLVEAGMALAFGMPSVYFVRDRGDLPWMLRDVGGSGVTRLGSVKIVEYKDDDDLIRQIKADGMRLFPSRVETRGPVDSERTEV